MTTTLKGILYQSGNIDFPKSLNEWAFQRMSSMKHGQENRIVVNPSVAPIEISASPELDPAETKWLEPLQEMVNASSKVNLQRRESTLRLRKSIYDIDNDHKIVTLVTQEAVSEFAEEHWQRIAFFYAYRHDGFRFDIGTMISIKDKAPQRPETMELITRIVPSDDRHVNAITFDATGSTANVNIVEWRGSVHENATGRFKNDELEVKIAIPQSKLPTVFLYENRLEFKNHAYIFSGDKLKTQLRRMFKRKKQADLKLMEEAEAKAKEVGD